MTAVLRGLKCLRSIDRMKTPKSMTWESLVMYLDPAREPELDRDVQLLKELNPRLATSE